MMMKVGSLFVAGAMTLLIGGCGSEDAAVDGTPTRAAITPPPPPQTLRLVHEAEAMSGLQAPMMVSEEAGTSGGNVVRIPAGLDKNAPLTGRFTIPVELASDQQVTIWMRVHWSGTCANSVTLKAPGMPEMIVGEDGTYGSWHWVKVPNILPLKQGTVELVVGQREEDIGIDQILITSDADYVPQGIEE